MRSPAYTESFLEDPIFVCFPAHSAAPVLTMEHIYLDLIPGERALQFSAPAKKAKRDALGEGEGKNTLGMSYWFLLPFFTQLKLIHSRTYELGRLCKQPGKLLI